MDERLKKNFYETKEQFYEAIKKDEVCRVQFNRMSDGVRNCLTDFYNGKKTMPFTYDAFFKFVFSPDRHEDRLAELISGIIGQKVKIKKILSNESEIFSDDGSLAILDHNTELYMIEEQHLQLEEKDRQLKLLKQQKEESSRQLEQLKEEKEKEIAMLRAQLNMQ